jgi:hypothetical protein
VIPATSAWWQDHYSDLRRHLQADSHVVRRDETCVIYGLGRRDPDSVPTGSAVETQLRDLVAAILPEGCRVIALGSSYPALAGAGTFDLVEAPSLDWFGGVSPEAGLEANVEKYGADYLILPALTARRPGGDEVLVERARAAWPVVTDQSSVATVFSLKVTPRTEAKGDAS